MPPTQAGEEDLTPSSDTARDPVSTSSPTNSMSKPVTPASGSKRSLAIEIKDDLDVVTAPPRKRLQSSHVGEGRYGRGSNTQCLNQPRNLPMEPRSMQTIRYSIHPQTPWNTPKIGGHAE
ncbi:uncharacterized protein PV06_09577 [Exophiala oligosperma]|uniref:Uncharacterized protein n=1 Tax=Exophiala oligosperma TaxID=215243 RepID=A0A0D2D869_9EURO|nr:uncharacterized protein PV06_09577 [Exophiala oligosperma]KIW38625.1 hypothetical protein PV06_09577 [Exophiala oligosperma]